MTVTNKNRLISDLDDFIKNGNHQNIDDLKLLISVRDELAQSNSTVEMLKAIVRLVGFFKVAGHVVDNIT